MKIRQIVNTLKFKFAITIAAVTCSPIPYFLAGVKMGFWLRASRAVHGSVHGWCMGALYGDVVMMWCVVLNVVLYAHIETPSILLSFNFGLFKRGWSLITDGTNLQKEKSR